MQKGNDCHEIKSLNTYRVYDHAWMIAICRCAQGRVLPSRKGRNDSQGYKTRKWRRVSIARPCRLQRVA